MKTQQRLGGNLEGEKGACAAQAVAWCIQHLTESLPEARDAVRENGTLPLLVGILKSSAEASARERAAWAICNTATQNPENRAAFRSAALSFPTDVRPTLEDASKVAQL